MSSIEIEKHNIDFDTLVKSHNFSAEMERDLLGSSYTLTKLDSLLPNPHFGERINARDLAAEKKGIKQLSILDDFSEQLVHLGQRYSEDSYIIGLQDWAKAKLVGVSPTTMNSPTQIMYGMNRRFGNLLQDSFELNQLILELGGNPSKNDKELLALVLRSRREKGVKNVYTRDKAQDYILTYNAIEDAEVPLLKSDARYPRRIQRIQDQVELVERFRNLPVEAIEILQDSYIEGAVWEDFSMAAALYADLGEDFNLTMKRLSEYDLFRLIHGQTLSGRIYPQIKIEGAMNVTGDAVLKAAVSRVRTKINANSYLEWAESKSQQNITRARGLEDFAFNIVTKTPKNVFEETLQYIVRVTADRYIDFINGTKGIFSTEEVIEESDMVKEILCKLSIGQRFLTKYGFYISDEHSHYGMESRTLADEYIRQFWGEKEKDTISQKKVLVSRVAAALVLEKYKGRISNLLLTELSEADGAALDIRGFSGLVNIVIAEAALRGSRDVIEFFYGRENEVLNGNSSSIAQKIRAVYGILSFYRRADGGGGALMKVRINEMYDAAIKFLRDSDISEMYVINALLALVVSGYSFQEISRFLALEEYFDEKSNSVLASVSALFAYIGSVKLG